MTNNYPKSRGNYGVRKDGNGPLWLAWRGMNYRCYKNYSSQYRNYGGRGITVCDEWRHDARAFIAWARANGWKSGLSLDRIDNDGPYSPQNCRFASSTTQARNRRTNLMLIHNGVRKCLAEWCEELGADIRVVSSRLKTGHTFEEAFGPVDAPPAKLVLTSGGHTMTAKQWAKEVGVHESTIYKRYCRGADLAAPRGPSGPKAGITVYSVRPGPKTARRHADRAD